MDIKCKKCECKHNKSCSCCASAIKVGKGVDCETYEFSEQNADSLKQQTAKNMFEITDLSPRVPNKSVKIACDAKCLFNSSGICRANGITVLEANNLKNTPFCVTQIDEWFF